MKKRSTKKRDIKGKLFLICMLLAVAGGVALDEWYRAMSAEVVYAKAPEPEPVPKEVMIVIDYSGWTRERIQQEILKELPSVFLKIAECESGTQQYHKGTDDVILGKVTPADTGLFQINKDYHLGTAKRLGYDLDTPVGNIAYTAHLYASEGLAPWNASRGCWGN